MSLHASHPAREDRSDSRRPTLSLCSQDQQQIEALIALAECLKDQNYHFVTGMPATHALVNARPAAAQARNLRDIFGWSQPFKKSLIDPKTFLLMERAGVLERDAGLWRSRVRISALDNDLYLHSAYPTAGAESVFFGPDTYKFVDNLKAYLRQRARPIRRAADICTGAGPGGIAIAHANPDADVFLIDINPKALLYATANVGLAGEARAYPTQSNLLSDIAGQFDLISAHPPYLIDRHARTYRHGGGALGADLSLAIVRAALQRLSPGGSLFLFTGVAIVAGEDRFKRDVQRLVAGRDLDWTYREVDPDVFGEELTSDVYRETERIALIVLTVTRRSTSA
jgi:methylase of polypeptide subunit release factors